MNVFGSSFFALVVTVGLSALALSTDGEEPTVRTQTRPMNLSEMLKLLPACPDKWELKRSQAQRLYRDHLEAYAMREYQKIIPPGSSGQKDATKPETVQIVIRDTCGLGSHIEPFRKETPPALGGDFSNGNWGQFPAMMVRLGKDRRALRVLVGDRFVVELVFSGDNPKALNLWMKQCNLKALTQIEKRSPMIIREKVALRFLDELHPNRTRSHAVPVLHDRSDGPTEDSGE